MPSIIHTLTPISSPSTCEPGPSLRDQIETGLLGTTEPTIPGSTEEDKKWAYTKSVPTLVLYDEQGLRLYDKITSDAPEYYLFADELNLLKTHGKDIARAMGFPGKDAPEYDSPERNQSNEEPPTRRWRQARWGDMEVGKWNQGVNGEQGIAGGVNRGYDVVELGAGALRKTGHLLSALAASVPDSDSAPITYHPLDLSYPELDRVLGEMDEAFGQELQGKVQCIGLHGDYEAGLQMIREGNLPSLRQMIPEQPRGRFSERAGKTGKRRDSSLSPVSDSQLVTPAFESKILEEEPSPSYTMASDMAVLPDHELSSLPSAITETDGSSTLSKDKSGTWSPVSDGEVTGMSMSVPNEFNTKGLQLALPPMKHTTSTAQELPARPLHLVFLGSSLGNFSRDSAAPFLKSLPLRHGDTLLLGLDGRPTPGHEGNRKVEIAYNDPAGHTRAFEEHGWEIVREELGLEGDAGVEFVGRYNEKLGRHEAYFRSKAQQTLHLPSHNTDVTLEENELLNIEWSYKYSYDEALQLFKEADLRLVNSWKAPDSEYRLWLLERPLVSFSGPAESPITTEKEKASIVMPKNVPKWAQWLDLWKLWDHITLDMIPEEALHQKPIDLRHICLFYLGHIPTFLDIHLTRMTNGAHTEPEKFKDIFERGIDPDVDDPTKIHSHSEVPAQEEDWPTLAEILSFRDRVRARLRGIYDQLESGQLEFSRHIGRVLFMTFEHEAMHAETLLYMLQQSPLTRAPTAVAQPQWASLAKRWARESTPNKVLTIEGGAIELGHDDLEADDAKFTNGDWADHEFGWDNEHPRITTQVKRFQVDSLPISNQDYLEYVNHKGIDLANASQESLPASWVKVDGEWRVRSLYGPVSFDVAGGWPLMASRNEIKDFAASKGGRLPTEPELRMLWKSDDGPRPAGKLANIGFENWHPIPPAHTQTDNAGRVLHGHNGGVWEWTDSVFEPYEGYVPSEIYPGYSADFFDQKHYVVLGGSYATVPTLAGRESVRNWYQSNYRFSFIGGRVVYDL